MELKNLIIEKIKNLSETAFENESEFRGDLTLTINENHIVEVCGLLKKDTQLKFELLKDITAIDWSTRKNRFTLVYHIFSFQNNFELCLKCNIAKEEIDSVTSIWRGANWYERETYDMYGIKFRNHPDLRRMYMPEEFEYYPLRKEFPLMGIPGSIPLPNKKTDELQ